MAINLVDMAKGYVGRAVMDKIAGSLGGSTDQTESALNAAIPSILGGLINKAGTEDGAKALSYELDKHDGGFLDNIGDALSGDGLGKLAGAGSGILGSLLGDSKLGSMLDLIGKVSGMGRSGSGSIVGLVGSLLMGILGKQKRSSGLDVGGLMDLLKGQKAHVAGSLPAGMGNILGLGDLGSWGGDAAGAVGDAFSGTVGAAGDAVSGVTGAVSGGVGAVGDAVSGGVGAVGDAVSGGVGAVGDAVSGGVGAVGGAVSGGVGAVGGAVSGGVGAVGDAGRAVGGAVSGGAGKVGGAVSGGVGKVGGAVSGGAGAVGGAVGGAGQAAAKSGGGIAKLLIPLLLVVALGLLLLRLLGGCGGIEKPTIGLPEVGLPGIEMPDLGAIEIPGLDAGLKDKVGGIFGDLSSNFEGITDVDSAKSAVPGLTDLTGKIGGLTDGLAPAQSGPLGKMVGMFLPQITQQVDRIKAIPGVGAIVGNVIDGLMAKLTAL